MSDQDNISSFGPGGGRSERLPDDKLMAYLAGKLSAAEQHEVEQWLADEGMESDAVEGLSGLDPDDTKHTVSRLNHQLRKTIGGKKRGRRHLKPDQNAWVAVVILLMLVVAAYMLIKMMK